MRLPTTVIVTTVPFDDRYDTVYPFCVFLRIETYYETKSAKSRDRFKVHRASYTVSNICIVIS